MWGFHSGEDRVSLSQIDANSSASGNQAFHFTHHAQAHAVWLTHSAGAIVLHGDVTGDAVADFSIDFAGITEMHGSDILL